MKEAHTMLESKRMTNSEQTIDARKPRADYQRPAIKKEGNLKKITALSFEPPA
jgi:hypothetical protein